MLMVLFIYKLNWRGIAHTPLLINLVPRLSPMAKLFVIGGVGMRLV